MGLLDNIKGYFNAFDDEEIEEEIQEEAIDRRGVKKEEPRKAETPRIINGKNKSTAINPAQMQVVLVKPERYEDVTSIADHLNDKKTVVLNLEAADRDLSRRIVDFLSGATYANHGNIKKISKGTFLIVPNGVDMMGELLLDEFEEGRMYF
ncbi:MAG: cell division protein SepF [Clostridia bacterium]|nr:cell division protein SepF [Clostridia bacterium]